jgi:uncharacterized membrane protein
MNTVPNIWRTEVWHALSVHFPIVLLSLSSLFFLIILPFIRRNKAQWVLMASIMLYLGTITAWVAIYTGGLADGIVSRQICDPTVLKSHENAAYIMGWIFTSASLLELALQFKLLEKIRKFVRAVSLLLLLAGLAYVAYTGHLGASLVYQQGAGVYHPTENCSEFQ